MVGWHHGLDGREFEQAPGDSQGQGNSAYCMVHGVAKSPHTAQLGLLDQGLFPFLRNHNNEKV